MKISNFEIFVFLTLVCQCVPVIWLIKSKSNRTEELAPKDNFLNYVNLICKLCLQKLLIIIQ